MKKLFSLFGHFVTSIKVSYKASPLFFFCRIAMELFNVFIPLVLAYITKLIINLLGHPAADVVGQRQTFVLLVGIMVAVQIGNMLIGRITSFITTTHNDLISHQIQRMILHKVNVLDISYYDNPKFYNELNNANRDSQSLMSLTWMLTAVIRGIVQIITCGIILGKLYAIIPVIIALLNVPSGFIDKYVSKKKYDWQKSRATNERKINYLQYILNSKQYAKDMRVFNIKDYFFNKWETHWRIWYKEKLNIERSRIVLSFLAGILPYVATIFVFVYVGMRIIGKTLTIGDFTYYTTMTSQFITGIGTLLSSINQGYESEMRLTSFMNFLKWKTNILETGETEIKEINEIEFRDVSFVYPNTDSQVLKNVSFKIEKNVKVALVGLNGAGKSTLIKLLLRLYEPSSGTIYVNGTDIRLYKRESLLQTIGVVFQDFNRYDFSVRENVALGQIESIENDELIYQSLDDADLTLPLDKDKGLDSPIGKSFYDDGLELSGGQWQKLAISQAYLKTCTFIVMDEPNSSLDPDAEHKLFIKMKDICKDKGAIFITHRLSSVSIADKIIVIDAGECAEVGTHYELMAQKGLYYKLFMKQAEKYTVLQR